MWCQTPTRPSPLGPAGRGGEVPAAGALAVQDQAGAVGAEAEVLGERELLLQRRERARALQAQDAVLGRDVVGDGDQRLVLRVGDHQLDLVALRVPEDQRLGLGRVQPQQLGVVLVGDQPVHPVLERVVGADAQDHPVDVAVTGDAGLGLVELEEGDDAGRVALLVAEVGVVAERRLEVERVLDEPQAHDATPEVDVGDDVAGDAREVVRAFQRLLQADLLLSAEECAHSITYRRVALTAPRTVAGQVAEHLKAEILAGDRAPGTRLPQVEIARTLGVSTTPVREALAALQREGLVRLHPQRGAVVFLPSVDDLREHYEIRAALESLAAAKAAEHFEPAWAPPLVAAARRDARGAARAATTSRSTSASTPRSTSTRTVRSW